MWIYLKTGRWLQTELHSCYNLHMCHLGITAANSRLNLPVKVLLPRLSFWREGQRERHNRSWFQTESHWGDVGGGSTGTQPRVRVFNSVKALLFFFFLMSRMRQKEIKRRSEQKMDKGRSHKDNYVFFFVSLKAALVSTGTKLYGASEKSWPFKQDLDCLSSQFLFIKSRDLLRPLPLSFSLARSDLVTSHSGVAGVHCPDA